MYLQKPDQKFMHLGFDYNYTPAEQSPGLISELHSQLPIEILIRHKAILEGNKLEEGIIVKECRDNPIVSIENGLEVAFTKAQLMCHVFIEVDELSGNFQKITHAFPTKNSVKYVLDNIQAKNLCVVFINQKDVDRTIEPLFEGVNSYIELNKPIPNLFIWELYPSQNDLIKPGGEFCEKIGLSYVMDQKYLTIWKYVGEELELIFSTSSEALKRFYTSEV